MAKIVKSVMVLAGLGLLALGCGVTDNDFQAGNRLKLQEIANTDGSETFVLNAVEETNDFGQDNQEGTNDAGEGDAFPDPQETVLTPLDADRAVLTLDNEPRLGVDPGVDLRVFRVDVTYLDANGQSQAFAPTFSQTVDKAIPSGGSETLEIVLVPKAMKTVAGGLREIFLFDTAPGRQAVERMTAILDVYARDDLNDDTVHTQGAVTLFFVNPME